MDLTITLADLTATSACELRLYTELRECAQKQSALPPEKSERAREAYRECLRVLTEGGMVSSGVVGGEHAGGTARPVSLVATSEEGLTYTVELDRLECPTADSAARIICTPHPSEAAHRALLRGALAAHLLTAGTAESTTESAKNAVRLDLYLEHENESKSEPAEPTEHTAHSSPTGQPHRVDSARILPLIRLQEQRLLLLTQALNEGLEPAELAQHIPYLLTCGECPACLNAAAPLALATDTPELVTEDTAENPETEEHPAMYRVPAAVENDSEQYRLQCLLDAQLASLEEHAAVRALDHSYVAVQGPPGAGKTFLASHVIARLVAEGAKVGVVAQSHAVIENLMLACCARDGFDVSRAVRLRGKSVTPDAPWSEVSDSELVELISGAGGMLFGGTVWDYVSERRVPAGSLDVLVVDEAGQFSLTNTVAAARAARSVLLLGDPQQLPQVSTGVHPYPVDVSALGWLSDGAAALDPRFGYFLGESWRMDSALCERVSWLSYDGALASAAATAGRALQGVAPGVVSYPVEHAGCSVRSVQEAQAVVDCVRELLGREWVPAAGAEPRPLAAEDCIVVAAYNAQVDCVREALIAAGLADSSGAGVRVGTVDKFQGQEAAVVLVSLASSRVDSGRGAGFVLSPNRLNVAVSRGQWQAVLVHSPWVARSVPQDVEEVLALSGFAGLVE